MLRLSQTDLALSSDELKELRLVEEAASAPIAVATSPAPSTFSPPSISTHSQSLPTTPRFSDPVTHEGTPVSPPSALSPTSSAKFSPDDGTSVARSSSSSSKVSRKQRLRQSRRKKRGVFDSSPLTRITHAAESCSVDAITDVIGSPDSIGSSSSKKTTSVKSSIPRGRRRFRYHKRINDAVHQMVGSSTSVDSGALSLQSSMTPTSYSSTADRTEMKRHMSEPPKGRGLSRGEKLRSRRRLRDRVVGVSGGAASASAAAAGFESPSLKPEFMSPKSEGAALHRRGVGFAPPLLDDSEDEDDEAELIERTDSMRRAKTVGGQTTLTLSESKSTPMQSVKIARVKFFCWNTDMYNASMFDIKGFTAVGRAPMISSSLEDWSEGAMISCSPELHSGDTIRFKLTISDSIMSSMGGSTSSSSSTDSSSSVGSMIRSRGRKNDLFSIGLVRQVFVVADDETIITAGTPASKAMPVLTQAERFAIDPSDCATALADGSATITTPKVSPFVSGVGGSSSSVKLEEYPPRKDSVAERDDEPVLSECWLNQRGTILESIDQSMGMCESRWSLPRNMKNGDVISVKIEDESETVIFAIEDPMLLHLQSDDDDDSEDEFDCWKIHKVDVDFPLPSSVGGTGWLRSPSSIRRSDSFCKLQRIESIRFIALFKCFTPGIKLSIV